MVLLLGRGNCPALDIFTPSLDTVRGRLVLGVLGDTEPSNLDTSTNASTKDKHFEIKFYDKNQVDGKIAWGLSEGFLLIHWSYVC